MEGVVLLLQVLEVGDAVAGDRLPGRQVEHHQVGVEAEESNGRHAAQDQDHHVNDEENILRYPLVPRGLVHNGAPARDR